MAPPKTQGGRISLVASWMTCEAPLDEICARLNGTAAKEWQEKMAFHAAAVEQRGLSLPQAQAERLHRAAFLVRGGGTFSQ